MKSSILNFALSSFTIDTVIAHSAEAKKLALEMFADDKLSHDLMWLTLEGDFSNDQLARLLGLSPARLVALQAKVAERAKCILTEVGVNLDSAASIQSSMRQNIPLFGRQQVTQ